MHEHWGITRIDFNFTVYFKVHVVIFSFPTCLLDIVKRGFHSGTWGHSVSLNKLKYSCSIIIWIVQLYLPVLPLSRRYYFRDIPRKPGWCRDASLKKATPHCGWIGDGILAGGGHPRKIGGLDKNSEYGVLLWKSEGPNPTPNAQQTRPYLRDYIPHKGIPSIRPKNLRPASISWRKPGALGFAQTCGCTNLSLGSHDTIDGSEIRRSPPGIYKPCK